MVFLGRDLMSHVEYSEKTAQKIDEEIANIIEKAYAHAKELIQKNKETLERIALQLLEKESLTSDDIQALLEGNGSQPPPKQKKRNRKEQPQSKEPQQAPAGA